MPTLAVYPGSFDPVTWGHLDLIERAARMFDRVVVAVLENADKAPLFTARERIALLEKVIGRRPTIAVEAFDGLLVDYARARGATAIIRGLRAVSDFEYEFQMALMNRHLAADLETVFLMPKQDYTFISSRLTRQIAQLGGEVKGLVPPGVAAALAEKFPKAGAQRAASRKRARR